MALTFPAIPQIGSVVVNEALVRDDEFAGIDPESVEIKRPQTIFTADEEALGHPDGFLARAQPTAWQYVITVNDEAWGLAEVAITGTGDPDIPSYAALYETEYTEAVLRTMSTAAELAQVQNENYEVRILRAPSLSLFAVWLHGKSDDLLLPIELEGSDFVPPVMTEDEVVKQLIPIAERRLNVPDL